MFCLPVQENWFTILGNNFNLAMIAQVYALILYRYVEDTLVSEISSRSAISTKLLGLRIMFVADSKITLLR